MVQNEIMHPDAKQLAEFGLGKLNPAASAEIESHVSGCDSCCETLRSLEDDTFVNLVREAETASDLQPAAISGSPKPNSDGIGQ